MRRTKTVRGLRAPEVNLTKTYKKASKEKRELVKLYKESENYEKNERCQSVPACAAQIVLLLWSTRMPWRIQKQFSHRGRANLKKENVQKKSNQN